MRRSVGVLLLGRSERVFHALLYFTCQRVFTAGALSFIHSVPRGKRAGGEQNLNMNPESGHPDSPQSIFISFTDVPGHGVTVTEFITSGRGVFFARKRSKTVKLYGLPPSLARCHEDDAETTYRHSREITVQHASSREPASRPRPAALTTAPMCNELRTCRYCRADAAQLRRAMRCHLCCSSSKKHTTNALCDREPIGIAVQGSG